MYLKHLLKILGTVTVTSCESETSGSILKRLNNYLRDAIGQMRLSALAVVRINLNVEFNVERVMDLFRRKARALEFIDVCSIAGDSNNGNDATQ